MKRWLAPVVVGLLSAAVFVRSAAWGWPQLDDVDWLQWNSHLGLGWSDFCWALTTAGPGHRWMPVAWLVWDLVPSTCAAWHWLALGLGGSMVALFVRLAEDFMPAVWAVLMGLLFGLSPLRAELFCWGMGCEYESMMIFALLAWMSRRSWWCVVFAVLSLLSYPAAAGLLLVLAGALFLEWASGEVWSSTWRNWSLWRMWALVAAVGLVAVVESAVGRSGVHQWHPQFALLVVPHLLFSQLVPFAVSPVFPPALYWGIYVGAVAFFALAAWDWRIFVAVGLASGPIVFAAIREPFWLGARYSVVVAVPLLLWLGSRLAVQSVRRRRVAVVLLCCYAGVWAGWSWNVVTYRSFEDVVRQTRLEARSAGIAVARGWDDWEGPR